MNIKALKEFIENLPDEMPVVTCCSDVFTSPTVARVVTEAHWDNNDEDFDIEVLKLS